MTEVTHTSAIQTWYALQKYTYLRSRNTIIVTWDEMHGEENHRNYKSKTRLIHDDSLSLKVCNENQDSAFKIYINEDRA